MRLHCSAFATALTALALVGLGHSHAASAADTTNKPVSTFRATHAPEATRVAGHVGAEVALGFTDGFVHYIGWWEHEGRPCRAAVGGIKLENGKWQLLWQEAELGKCPRTDDGLKSLSFDPPVTMKWQDRIATAEDHPTLLRSISALTTVSEASPQDEVVKGLTVKGYRYSGGVLLPREEELSEKRVGGRALYTDGACPEGKAIRKVFLQKGKAGLGKDAIVGLRVECAAPDTKR